MRVTPELEAGSVGNKFVCLYSAPGFNREELEAGLCQAGLYHGASRNGLCMYFRSAWLPGMSRSGPPGTSLVFQQQHQGQKG